MPPLRLRPHADPLQRDGAAVLVHVAALEHARDALAPGPAHLGSGDVGIVGVNEADAGPADHLLGPVAEDRERARADLDEHPLRIRHHDQVERGLEQPAALGGLLRQRRRLLLHLGGHAGEGVRQRADLAARVGRNAHPLAPPEGLDRARHRDQRPRQRARQQDRQDDREQDGGETGERGSSCAPRSPAR